MKKPILLAWVYWIGDPEFILLYIQTAQIFKVITVQKLTLPLPWE